MSHHKLTCYFINLFLSGCALEYCHIQMDNLQLHTGALELLHVVGLYGHCLICACQSSTNVSMTSLECPCLTLSGTVTNSL